MKYRSIRHLVITSLATLLFGFPSPSNAAPSDHAGNPRPNIVIILADDMGYGDPGCYNPSSKCPTPSIDRLAAGGMRFTDAHAAGAWCTPSRYGLLTGRYAFRTSLAWQKQAVIGDDIKTVADTLRTAGYRTAMVGKWHLGFDGGTQVDYEKDMTGGPLDRGFDTYFGLPASLDIPDFYWIRNRRATRKPTIPIADSNSDGWSPIQGRFWRSGLRGEDFVMEKVLDQIAREAVQRIGELAKTQAPFLLYMPLTSPHTPWLPGEAYQEANKAGLYSQFVNHTDDVVGRVLASLDETGVASNTVVVFASDNGPVWYPHDTQRFDHDSLGGLRGMKGDVWEAGHRVPFIVRWPSKVATNSVNDQLVSFVDLHATLAEIAGVDAPGSAVDSISLVATLLGSQDVAARAELISFHAPIALRAGRWKLINRLGSAGFLAHQPNGRSPFLQNDELNPSAASNSETPDGQLYDLTSDPGETRNLWRQQPERVKQLLERLAELSQ